MRLPFKAPEDARSKRFDKSQPLARFTFCSIRKAQLMYSLGIAATAFFFSLAIGLAGNGLRGVRRAAFAGWVCGVAAVLGPAHTSDLPVDPVELAIRSLVVTVVAVALAGFGHWTKNKTRPT